MLTADGEATDFGVQTTGSSVDVVNRSITDALAAKSTATLYKRARSMGALFTWIRSHGLGTGLDFKEPQLYEFLCVMRESSRGATSGEALLQAIRFFHSLFGLRHFNPSNATARIKGVSHAMFVTKRSLQQARALYVTELRALERIVLHDDNPHLIIIAGYLLFCVMAVCRFSDAMYVKGFRLSKHQSIVLLEAGTSVHKAAHTKEKKTMLLPLVALGVVLEKTSWAERWMEFRNRCLKPGHSYSLPAYSESNSEWLSRPITTGEGVLWLKDLVSLHCATGETLTTHSLKGC